MSSYAPKRLEKAQIVPSTFDGQDINVFGELPTFFLNPASWTDTKSSKWVKMAIPGLSDPHQQWVTGGARTITFEALVTNDRPRGEYSSKTLIGAKLPKINKVSVFKKIGGIASSVFNIPELSLTSVIEASGINPASNGKLDLDITQKLNFYRSMVYPSALNEHGALESAPYPVKLKVGSSLGKRTQNSLFVVDNVSVTITKQLPNLTPIEARVTFTLTELVNFVVSAEANILTDV